MPSKKKKFNSRFPPARIKKIMQTDEEVGKVAAPVPVIISRSLELFIESLILKAGETTVTRNAKTLTTSHIKQTIESEKKFDFLRDLVANIPDHQPEEEGESSKPEKVKGRVGRPRKIKDGEETAQPRKRKIRQKSSESSENNEDEETHGNSSTESDTEEHEHTRDKPEDMTNNISPNNNPFSYEAAMRLSHPGYNMPMPPPLPSHHFNSGMMPNPAAMGMPPMPNFNMMPHMPPMHGLPPGMPPFPPMGYPPFDRMPYPIPHMSHPQFTPPVPSSSNSQASRSSHLSSSPPSSSLYPSSSSSHNHESSPQQATPSHSSSHQASTTDEDDYDT